RRHTRLQGDWSSDVCSSDLLPGVAAALRPGGAVCAACVNAPSVQRFCEELRSAGGWGLIQTFEVLERGWTVRDRSLRPAHRMVEIGRASCRERLWGAGVEGQ